MVYKILEMLLKSDFNYESQNSLSKYIYFLNLGNIILFGKKNNLAWMLSSEAERLKQINE